MTKISAVTRFVVQHMRAWAMLAWTGTIAAFIAQLSSESPAQTSESPYCDMGLAGVENAVITFVVIVVWPVGLALIWAAAVGWASLMRWHELEARDRRARRGY
jgi:hypothetical protein